MRRRKAQMNQITEATEKNPLDRPGQNAEPPITGESMESEGIQYDTHNDDQDGTQQAFKPQKSGHQQAPRTTLRQDIIRLLLKIFGICAVMAFILTFLYGVFQYHDLAMEPAVRDGDLILFYRLDKEYTAGETVVVKYEGENQVRRVVAVAGDEVDITQEGLMVNGAYQSEPRVTGETHRYKDGTDFPVTLKEGQIFVLADNREDAVDSRIYGPVDIKDARGKVMTILRRKDI